MSLVGPRPEVPRYVALYPPELRDKVLSVRPGITDPASLRLPRRERAARRAPPTPSASTSRWCCRPSCAARPTTSIVGDLRLVGRPASVLGRTLRRSLCRCALSRRTRRSRAASGTARRRRRRRVALLARHAAGALLVVAGDRRRHDRRLLAVHLPVPPRLRALELGTARPTTRWCSPACVAVYLGGVRRRRHPARHVALLGLRRDRSG